MSHLSDKELDRLSREAAEQNDVPQNTSGWDSLHLRLEKELPVNPRRQRRNLLLLLSLLVLLTGSGLVYRFVSGPNIATAQPSKEMTAPDEVANNKQQLSTTQRETQNKIHKSDNKDQDVASQSSSGTGIKDNNKDIKEQKNPASPSPSLPTADNQNSSSTDKQNTIEKLPTQPGGRTNIKGVTSDRAAGLSTIKGASGQKQTMSPDVAPANKRSSTKNVLQQQTQRENYQLVVNDPEPSIVGLGTIPGLSAISKPAIDRNNIVAAVTPVTPAMNKPQKQSDRKFPFSLSLVGGADWTSVRFTHKEQAGYNAGLTFTWHFAKNFSVTTGALYTQKNYSAYGEDYHPPKGYWTNYITLKEVNGSCWMIDIPLNLRYDFAGGKKSSFFGSAGASTYLMDKESYTYHYIYNGNYTKRNWENDKNSSHLFSILNLSAGYEKTVGRNVSAQIEPYLKMPISGIGFGNMQMSSYGLNFSIRYRPEFKKQNSTATVKNP